MKTLLLTLLSVLSCGILYAQSNFKPGYVITNTNDTIVGLIDYRTDQMNALTCTFKRTETSPVEKFFPGEIAGFRFMEEGKFYVSREINLNAATQLVFLEYLVHGTMNLYFYADKTTDLNYYVFENQDGTLYYVTKQPDKIEKIDNKNVIQKDIQYKRMAGALFKDVPELKEKASNIEFKQESMISIVKDYHDLTCTTGEPCIVFEGRPDKNYWKFKFSVYGGAWFINTNESHHVYSTFGVQGNISIPRAFKSWSLMVDLALTAYPFSSTKANAYTFIMGPRYTYPKGTVRPFAEVGAMLAYANYDYTYLNLSYGGFVTEKEYYFSLCFHGAIGLNFKTGLDSYIFLSASASTVTCFLQARSLFSPRLTLGYTF